MRWKSYGKKTRPYEVKPKSRVKYTEFLYLLPTFFFFRLYTKTGTDSLILFNVFVPGSRYFSSSGAEEYTVTVKDYSWPSSNVQQSSV